LGRTAQRCREEEEEEEEEEERLYLLSKTRFFCRRLQRKVLPRLWCQQTGVVSMRKGLQEAGSTREGGCRTGC